MPLHVETPLVASAAVSHGDQRVWLKLESLQPSGSFKLRGVGHACEVFAAQGARRLLSSSGGNAGMAVAYAGRALGLPVTVVVPATTSERARALIRGHGAALIVHGASWMEANDHLQTLRGPTDAFVHPFDDALLWRGHATMIHEAATQGPRPEVVVVSVGGGGLLCGVLEGMHACGWTDVPVLAVETVGAASLHAAIAAGQLVTLDAITSIATSLGARRVCAEALAWTTRHPVVSTVVTDAAAIRACVAIADDQRLLIEPACGAAVAAVQAREAAPLHAARDVLVILCGGATVGHRELSALELSAGR